MIQSYPLLTFARLDIYSAMDYIVDENLDLLSENDNTSFKPSLSGIFETEKHRTIFNLITNERNKSLNFCFF